MIGEIIATGIVSLILLICIIATEIAINDKKINLSKTDCFSTGGILGILEGMFVFIFLLFINEQIQINADKQTYMEVNIKHIIQNNDTIKSDTIVNFKEYEKL